jgi:hypothetical protein
MPLPDKKRPLFLKNRRDRSAPATPAPKPIKEMTASEKFDHYAVSYISRHSQYPHVLGAIRLGTGNSDIADHFINRGHFTDISRKTLVNYLSAFRRNKPELCKPTDGSTTLMDYDHLFDGNALSMTEEVELLKLIALQKSRIAIDFQAERNIGKLFNTTAKEVQVLGELVERLAKIKGTIKPASATGASVNDDESVRAGIDAIRQDEAQRQVIRSAVNDIMKKALVQK